MTAKRERFQVKNWRRFQHFKNRRPPWVKLYRDLLDDVEFHALTGDQVKVLVMLWLLASEDESTEGYLPDIKTITFRLRLESEEKTLSILQSLGEFLYQPDIKPISPCRRLATPET